MNTADTHLGIQLIGFQRALNRRRLILGFLLVFGVSVFGTGRAKKTILLARRSRNALLVLYNSLLESLSLLLEAFGRNESGQTLFIISVAVRLPPVAVLPIDHVQNVAFLEADAQLPAWNVHVVLGVVVEVRFNVHNL